VGGAPRGRGNGESGRGYFTAHLWPKLSGVWDCGQHRLISNKRARGIGISEREGGRKEPGRLVTTPVNSGQTP